MTDQLPAGLAKSVDVLAFALASLPPKEAALVFAKVLDGLRAHLAERKPHDPVGDAELILRFAEACQKRAVELASMDSGTA